MVDDEAIAIEECYGPHDIIFLEYGHKGSVVQVQDLKGALLWTMIPPDEHPHQKNVKAYVQRTAKAVFNVDTKEWAKGPKVFVSSVDIGESKSGSITFDPNVPFSDLWYAKFNWWSDGKNISFLLDTRTFDPGWSIDKLKRTKNVLSHWSPRKFRKVKSNKK